MDQRNVSVHLDSGEALLSVSHLALQDDGDLVNALLGGPSLEAVGSFVVRWFGGDPAATIHVEDAVNRFIYDYMETEAGIEWSASTEVFSYVSNAAASSSAVFAALGRERNGAFFS